MHLFNPVGPPDVFYGATHDACNWPPKNYNTWLYRVCRRGETPLTLRQPPGDTLFHDDELRVLVLDAVACGNSRQKPSPFLHTTTKLTKARALRHERSSLYSNWLVRFPRRIDGVKTLDLTQPAQCRHIVDETVGDSPLIRDMCAQVRAYSQKDSEVVVFHPVPLEMVEWWCELSGTWEPALALQGPDSDKDAKSAKASAEAARHRDQEAEDARPEQQGQQTSSGDKPEGGTQGLKPKSVVGG